MNRDELKAKAVEYAGAALSAFRDGWKKNTVFLVIGLLIGYAIKALRG